MESISKETHTKLWLKNFLTARSMRTIGIVEGESSGEKKNWLWCPSGHRLMTNPVPVLHKWPSRQRNITSKTIVQNQCIQLSFPQIIYTILAIGQLCIIWKIIFTLQYTEFSNAKYLTLYFNIGLYHTSVSMVV